MESDCIKSGRIQQEQSLHSHNVQLSQHRPLLLGCRFHREHLAKINIVTGRVDITLEIFLVCHVDQGLLRQGQLTI